MGLPEQTGVRPSPPAPFGPHAQKPASAESSHLGLLFFKITSGPFFLWLLNNREFPACISLDFFFPFPSFASAIPFCLKARSRALRPAACCPCRRASRSPLPALSEISSRAAKRLLV